MNIIAQVQFGVIFQIERLFQILWALLYNRAELDLSPTNKVLTKKGQKLIFPISRHTSVLYYCPSYFLRPPMLQISVFEDSTDNCIVVPTIAFQYRQSVGPRISRGCFYGSHFNNNIKSDCRLKSSWSIRPNPEDPINRKPDK